MHADHAAGRDGGNPPAEIEAAFLRHRALIVRICYGFLRNAEDADDAAQETFVRVLAHQGAITGDLGTYMRVTARNLCRDLLRRREVERRNSAALLAARSGDPVDVVLDQREIAGVLPHLSRNDLRLMAMRFAGFSYDEMAEHLGTSLKCVSVGLTRARRRARQLAATAPARLSALLGAVAQWRRQGRTGGNLAARNPVLVTQCVGLATGIALLSTPAGTTAHRDGPDVASRAAVAMAAGMSHNPDRTSHVVVGPKGAALLWNGGAAVGTTSSAPAHTATAPLHDRGSTPLVLRPTPQSTYFYAVAPSPDYAQNHTAYAWGYSGFCACILFFASHDAGHSWHLLPPATSWYGWTPSWLDVFGRDRLLAFSPGTGLLVTTPGGLAFSAVIPAAHAAHEPGTSSVMLSFATSSALVRLDLATMSTSPGPSLPPGFSVDEMAYAGTPRGLVVAGHYPSAVDWAGEQLSPFYGGKGQESVLACSATACTPQAALPFAAGQATMYVPRDPSSAQVAMTSEASNGVLLSRDGGRTWNTPPGAPAYAQVLTFVDHDTGTPDLLLTEWTPSGEPAIELDGANRTATSFGGGLFGTHYINLVAQLPDGRLLANFADGPAGLLCSTDGGSSWASSCP